MNKESTRSGKERFKVTKHQWTKEEDEKLLDCLKDLANSGIWKAENGTFRHGYLQQLERWMHEKVPGCQLKAAPHIESRVKLWKRQYYAIRKMLGSPANGFEWSDIHKCIICDKSVYDNWVKDNPNAQGLRGKSFPYLEELSIVFTRDRAMSVGSEAPFDATKETDRAGDDLLLAIEYNPQGHMNLHDVEFQQEESQGSQINATTNTEIQGQAKVADPLRIPKRRRSTSTDDADQVLRKSLKTIENMFQGTLEFMSKFANFCQLTVDDAIRKEKVIGELMRIVDLTDDERMHAGRIITSDTNLTNYFFTLPDNMRRSLVIWALQER